MWSKRLKIFNRKIALCFGAMLFVLGTFLTPHSFASATSSEIVTADQLLVQLLEASARQFSVKGKGKRARRGKELPGETNRARNIFYLMEHFSTTHGLRASKLGLVEAIPGYGSFYILVKNAKNLSKNPVALNLINDFIGAVRGKTFAINEGGRASLKEYVSETKKPADLKLPYKITFFGGL
jgi:hypothetical protein